MRCVRLQNCVFVCARVIHCRPVCAEGRGHLVALSAPGDGPYTTDFTADKSLALIGKPPVRGVRILSGRLRAALFLPSAVVAFVRRRRRLSRRGAPVLRPEFGPSVRADCSLMRLTVLRPCLACLPVRR